MEVVREETSEKRGEYTEQNGSTMRSPSAKIKFKAANPEIAPRKSEPSSYAMYGTPLGHTNANQRKSSGFEQLPDRDTKKDRLENSTGSRP